MAQNLLNCCDINRKQSVVMASTLSEKSTPSSEMRTEQLEILLKQAVSLHQQAN